MAIRPPLSGIYRDMSWGEDRVTARPSMSDDLRSKKTFYVFDEWPQWLRQVIVLHSVLAELQSTLYRA